MKYFLILFPLVLSGCLSVVVPVRTVADPQVHLTKQTAFAFLPEPDIRLEKRLFYQRAEAYLLRAGYKFVPEAEADYLVKLTVTISTAVTVSGRSEVTASREHATTFTFTVYEREQVDRKKLISIWEGDVSGLQADFRASEEQLVLGVFGHLGEAFQGNITLPKRG
jgi:hypothetical protein